MYAEWCQVNGRKAMTQRKFRREYAKELAASTGCFPASKTRPGRQPRAAASLTRVVESEHFLEKFVGEGAKKDPTRMCAVCNPAERQIRESNRLPKKHRPGRETRFFCMACNVALCVTPCCRFYHRNIDFVGAYKRWKAQQEVAALQGAQPMHEE